MQVETRRLLGRLAMVAVLIVALGCGCCTIIKVKKSANKPPTNATQVIATQMVTKVVGGTAKTNDAEKMLVAVQLTDMQKQLDAANRQIAELQRQVKIAPPVVCPAPNPAVTQILGQTGNSADMVLEMRTGRPAVIHELNAERIHGQAHLNASATRTVPRRIAAKAQDLQDSIESVERDIRRKEYLYGVAIRNTRNNTSNAGANAYRRMRNEEMRINLEKTYQKLADLQAELQMATQQ